MESNWCFPNKRKISYEEQKTDKNIRVEEIRLREKENETASSRLNEKPKNEENNNVESNWCFPQKKKALINKEQKIDKTNKAEQIIDKNIKAKEKRLREKENQTESSGLNEEQKINKAKKDKERRTKENENETSGLIEEQKIDKNNKAKEKRLREKEKENEIAKPLTPDQKDIKY